MAAFTSKATGNWNTGGQTTWNETGTPGSGDTVTINSGHTITVTADTSCAGITVMNGPLTVNSCAFTLLGNCSQGDAVFTLTAASANAKLEFDSSGGHRKWLQGTANSQTNNKIVVTTTGSYTATIRATSANGAHFDEGGEGSGSILNVGGWDCQGSSTGRVIFQNLGHGTNNWCIRAADFGAHSRIFLFCTFDNCKQQFGSPTYNWDGNSNASWRVEDCKWINQPTTSSDGLSGMRYVFSTTGSGTLTFKRNAVGEPSDARPSMVLGAPAAVEDCYFDSGPSWTGLSGCIPVRSVIRQSQRLGQTIGLGLGGGTWSENYLLADHVDPADRVNGTSGVGNNHFAQVVGTGTFSGLILEYPHANLIDQADGLYGAEDGTFAGATIQNCLIVPSMTDGYVSTNLHPMIHENNRVKLYHNTAVGQVNQLTFNERDVRKRSNTAQAGGSTTITLDTGASGTDDFYNNYGIWISGGTGSGQFRKITDYVGSTKVATVASAWGTNPNGTSTFVIVEIPVDECKSNLVVGVSQTGTEWGTLAYDLNGATIDQRDSMTPANVKNNWVYQPIPADGTVPGSVDGVRTRLSASPDGTNTFTTSGDPAFVDDTRCAARWAVYKSAVGGDPGGDHTGSTWKQWKRDALDAVRTLLMDDPTLGHSDLYSWVKAGFAPTNPSLQNAGHDSVTIGAVEFVAAGGVTTLPLVGGGLVNGGLISKGLIQ